MYVIRPGDNLWFLSATLLKNVNHYHKLLQYNNISDPKPLPPGTQLRIPFAWLKRDHAKVIVVHSRGQAEVFRHPKQQAQQLKNGDKLSLRDRIRTGPDSNVTLQFADSSTLLIQAESEVVLDTLSIYANGTMVETSVRLSRGRGEIKVPSEREPPSKFEIITPEAVTGVRGTEFRVERESERRITRSEVIEGSVEVTGGGITRIVQSGYGIIAEADKPLVEPRSLLPGPDLSGLPERIAALPVTFAWPSVEGAKVYRFQITSDASFTVMLVDTELTAPNYTLSNLSNGQYVLRVRAKDEFGFEGLSSDFSFTFEAQPAAPTVEEDPNDSESSNLVEKHPEFRWQRVSGAEGYRFQLAKDWEFRKILIDIHVGKTNHYTLSKDQQRLLPQSYYWRVAALDKSGKAGSFSTPQHVFLRSPPAIIRPTLSQ